MKKSENYLTDTRYQILFEPIKIGPVTAKYCFYQVLQYNGVVTEIHQLPLK